MSSKARVSSVEKDRSGSGPTRPAKDRKRFTPWLEQQLDHSNINGLHWIDRGEGLFRIPWVRVDKPEFEINRDAELFKRWAQHTGKYRVGDQPDPSTWKTRFRCALRKMQEIVEIKNMGNLEGASPYRIFKFERKLKGCNSPGKHSTRKRRRQSTSSADSSEACAPPELNTIPYPPFPALSQTHDLPNYTLPEDLFESLPSRDDMKEFDKYLPNRIENQFEDAMSPFLGIRNVPSNMGIASSFGCWGQESTYLGFQASIWRGYMTQEGANSSISNEVYENPDEHSLRWWHQEDDEIRFASWFHDEQPTFSRL